MTKKIILSGLVALTALLAGYKPALAATYVQEARWGFIIPKSVKDNQADMDRKFAPPFNAALSGGTACMLAHTGKGVVGGVSFSGAVADQAVVNVSVALYDSTVIGSHSAGTIDTVRLIFAGKLDTYRQSLSLDFSPPIPYANGLILCNGSATVITNVRYFKQQS